MTDMATFLESTPSEVKITPVLPSGDEFIFVIQGVNLAKNQNDKNYLELKLKAVEVVDSDTLTDEFLPEVDVAKNKFWITTNKSKEMLRDFSSGVLGQDPESAWKELFEDMYGRHVRGVVKHEDFRGRITVSVERFLPLEAGVESGDE